jgi:hypothetical protein
MLNTIKLRAAQIADAVKSDGWSSLLKQAVFFRRPAIVVEKDLSEVVERPKPLASAGLTLLEIDKQTLASGAYSFAVPYRGRKALRYLEEGCGGFAVVRDNVVVGDFWYWASEATNDPSVLHEDLQRFGFKTWKKSEVYTFDIFVAPSSRKNGVSAAFQNNAMLSLRSKGFTKAYGFYFADNLPAIFCTRMTNRWKELRVVNVSRFLLFSRTVPVDHVKGDFKYGRSVEKSAGSL